MRHARRRGQRNPCEAFRFMQFPSISELTECTGSSQPARGETRGKCVEWWEMESHAHAHMETSLLVCHRCALPREQWAPCANHLFRIVEETVMEDIYQHHLLPILIFVHVKQHVVSESWYWREKANGKAMHSELAFIQWSEHNRRKVSHMA